MKLSRRLKILQSVIEQSSQQRAYDHIWDCCCDHGFLGISLLLKQSAANIHFVDIVPKLIQSIEHKLPQLITSKSFGHTHCLDMAKLPLNSFLGKHLIIIAGVGGEQTQRFIKQICDNHPDIDLDFLLCPVHQLYTLRQSLIQQDFKLRHEILLEENKRFYEILLVSRTAQITHSNTNELNSTLQKIHPTGNALWRYSSAKEKETAQNYLNNTLQHYKRVYLGSIESKDKSGGKNEGKSEKMNKREQEIKQIILAYDAVTIRTED